MAEAGVEEEANLVVGSKFKLTLIYRKDVDYAKRKRYRAHDAVWDEAKAKAEAEWAALLQQDRAEIASVQAVEQQSLMLWDSLVMQQAVLNVVQK